MADFTNVLFAWNDWVVFPVFTLVALVVHIRRRKRSTLLLSAGLLVLLVGRFLITDHSQSPLHFAYIVGLIISSVGLVAAVVGAVWFLRKDYVAPSKQA